MAEDWDNLIILDACRFDLFEEENTIDGDLEKVVSAGSHTTEFLRNNFGDGRYLDTVYISATPRVISAEVESNFYHIEHLWQTHWDDELETVPPGEMAAATQEVAAEYPEKRVIAHFVQPHVPFIGETGREIHSEVAAFTGLDPESDRAKDMWDFLAEGAVSRSEVWQAYRENLELTMPIVEELVATLQGKTVITSDHGNSFGRLGVYGHPGRKFLACLVEVPWLTVAGEERKRIVEAPAQKEATKVIDSDVVSDRLSDLGYTE